MGQSTTPNHRRRDSTTPVLSPINQSLDVEPTTLSGQARYFSPVVPRMHTPGMALAERVEKLSIDASDIRRCLFPQTSANLNGNTGHFTHPIDSIVLDVHDNRICRKSNKSRLRRLWLTVSLVLCACRLYISHWEACRLLFSANSYIVNIYQRSLAIVCCLHITYMQ